MKLALVVQTPEVEGQIPVALLSGTLTEKVVKARAWGADGLELMTVDPARLNCAEIQGLMAEHAMEIPAIGSGALALAEGLTLMHPEAGARSNAAARLRDLIDFAKGVGAPLVTIGGFRGRMGSLPDEHGRVGLANRLREAGDYAAVRGIRLAIEPLNRYEADLVNTAEQGLAFLAEIDHPSVGLLLDTFHVNIEERSWEEPFEVLMVAGKLWHVHVGDNNRLPPGEGMIDFGGLIETLRGIGYDGWLSAELLARPDPDAAALTTLTRLRSLVETKPCA